MAKLSREAQVSSVEFRECWPTLQLAITWNHHEPQVSTPGILAGIPPSAGLSRDPTASAFCDQEHPMELAKAGGAIIGDWVGDPL